MQINLMYCIALILGYFCLGCNGGANQPADYEYPKKDPICLIENDPNLTVFSWTAEGHKFQPLPVGKVLVIPLYQDYRFNGRRDGLAIAHPFLYSQCCDIEKQLAAFGQRENLARLIIWAHGYFPTGMPHLASLSPMVNEQRVDILELQRCIRGEGSKIAAEMKALLAKDFAIEPWVKWEDHQLPPIHDSQKATMVNEPYDFAKLVRTKEYEGRFFRSGCARGYVLWGFNEGTRVVNRLNDVEKKMIAEFAAEEQKTQK
jgi:hypothetical protein